MKIIYCIAGTFNSGGMERVLANKANYLLEEGWDVSIVTTDQKSRSSYFKMDSGIKHYNLDIDYSDNEGKGLLIKIIAYVAKQYLHYKRLKRLLRKQKADIVISMFDHDVPFLYKINDGSKKILEIHFSRYKRLQYGRKGIWGIVDRVRSNWDLRLAKKYDRFVVLTEEDKSYWGSLDNMEVIPNANSFLPEGTAKLNKKVAVAVGRLDYQKGFDDLIKIWAMVQPVFPDWHLHIYGEGKLKHELKMLIDDLDMEQHIHLYQPTKKIEEVYLGSSVYLMTSRYEGLPMALLEAQACGVPLLSYTCKCGPRDIIEHGRNGFLIEEGDKVAFVTRLREVLSSDSLRRKMGDEAKLMSERFSETAVMQQWVKLFKEVLKEAK